MNPDETTNGEIEIEMLDQYTDALKQNA